MRSAQQQMRDTYLGGAVPPPADASAWTRASQRAEVAAVLGAERDGAGAVARDAICAVAAALRAERDGTIAAAPDELAAAGAVVVEVPARDARVARAGGRRLDAGGGGGEREGEERDEGDEEERDEVAESWHGAERGRGRDEM